MGYIILLGCVAGAIISVYLLADYINKKLIEREAAEKETEFASGGTVTSFNVAGDLFDPPETVVPVSVVSRLVSIREINEIEARAKIYMDGLKSLGYPIYLSKYILGMQEFDTTGLYVRISLPHLPWRTVQHVSELVGNYGQLITFKK